jgi:phage tail-like protein
MAEPKFLFLGQAQWASGAVAGLSVTPEGSLELQAVPLAEVPATAEDGGAATGIAVAPDGRVFWTDAASARIWVRRGRQAGAVPCIGGEGRRPGQLSNPQGLVAGPFDALYVADAGNSRVQVFDLERYQLIAIWDGLSEPWALAASPCGARLYVAERGAGRVAVLSLPAGRPGARLGEGILIQPEGLTVDAEGRIYVADPALGAVVVFDADGLELQRFTSLLQAHLAFAPTSIAVTESWVWVGNGGARRVEQFHPGGAHTGPARGYRGPVTDLRTDPACGDLLVATGTGIPIRMKPGVAHLTTGTFTSPPLDSGLFDCQWHKLSFQLTLPEGTSLKVETCTAPVIKTAYELDTGTDWAATTLLGPEPDGLIEMAVQSPPGRYLWVRLTLKSTGLVTPTVAWGRAYYPRSTYAEYLPAVYRSDPTSADFLDRFMLLFESVMGRWEAQLDEGERIYSALGTDPEFLPWLAAWIDFDLFSGWPEQKQRELLLQAIALYQKRGTPTGMAELLALYTRHRPVLVEGFQRRGFTRLACDGDPETGTRLGCTAVLPGLPEGDFTLCQDSLGAPLALGACPAPLATGAFQFTIYTYQYPGQSPTEAATLNDVAMQERPAGTIHHLCEVAPLMRVGAQSLIGVDTVLAGDYPPAAAGARGQPGTVLGAGRLPPEPARASPHALLAGRTPVLGRSDRLR